MCVLVFVLNIKYTLLTSFIDLFSVYKLLKHVLLTNFSLVLLSTLKGSLTEVILIL